MGFDITAICPYCGSEVIKTTNDKVYGRIYGNGMIYMCINNKCNSYVGCHNTGEPLGIIANAELRALKVEAHSLFDPFWKSRKMKRWKAYQKLSSQLKIKMKDCHFGHFDEEMLLKSIEILKTWE